MFSGGIEKDQWHEMGKNDSSGRKCEKTPLTMEIWEYFIKLSNSVKKLYVKCFWNNILKMII